MRRALESIETACAIPFLMQGYNLEDASRGTDEACLRQPVGVFAGIAPFNFPLMVPMWFLPLALAMGNTYVLKPSQRTPLSCARLMELFDQLGLPPGTINLVNGAQTVAEQLLREPGVDGVSFVGSTPVARHIFHLAAEHGKRAQCQGGAKNHLVVMPDADLPQAVPAIMNSAFGCAGERCLAGSVVLAVGGVYDRLAQGLVAAASRLVVGDGLDEHSQMGPVITPEGKARNLSYTELAIEQGAVVLLDGCDCRPEGCPGGYFLGPTIVGRVRPEMRVAQDKVFGPLLGLVAVESFEEALEVITANRYGNAASIFTSSGKWAREFQHRVRCGNIGVNVGVPEPIASLPFCGMRESFFGDLHGQGRDGVQFFSDRKVVISRWP